MCAVVVCLVSGGRDREIKAWNTETGEELCVLLGHKAEVTALHLTDGGRMLISGDSSGSLLVRAQPVVDRHADRLCPSRVCLPIAS